MGIIITGHQCSGTSHLRRILETHPDIAFTRALGCYSFLGMSFKDHSRCIVRSWAARKNNPILQGNSPESDGSGKVHIGNNSLFVLRYVKSLYRQKADSVTASNVTEALRAGLGGARRVGDKNHDYWFQLDRLAAEPNIRSLLIVRDVRDVASATVFKARGVFRNYWPAEMRDAGNVAQRWVHMVETANRNSDQIQVVYYEQLVSAPQTVLKQVAAFLDVDGEQFYSALDPSKTIGEYQQGLTAEELDRVLASAGDHMQALGYDLDGPGFKGAAWK